MLTAFLHVITYNSLFTADDHFANVTQWRHFFLYHVDEQLTGALLGYYDYVTYYLLSCH
jgi:hypothetical protein